MGRLDRFLPGRWGRAIATGRETTQSSLANLTHWASGLTPTYLEGALARALGLTPEAQMARELERLERLEASAEVRAETFERAAAAARSEASLAEAARERVEEGIWPLSLMRPSARPRRMTWRQLYHATPQRRRTAPCVVAPPPPLQRGRRGPVSELRARRSSRRRSGGNKANTLRCGPVAFRTCVVRSTTLTECSTRRSHGQTALRSRLPCGARIQRVRRHRAVARCRNKAGDRGEVTDSAPRRDRRAGAAMGADRLLKSQRGSEAQTRFEKFFR